MRHWSGPLGPYILVIPLVPQIKYAKPVGLTFYHGIRRLIGPVPVSLPPNPLLPLLSRRPCPPLRAAPMAAPPSGDSSSGTSTTAAAAKLHDEAIAAAKNLEDEAASLRTSNAERSQQLQEEADLLKSAAVALDSERAQADALEQQASAL